MGCMRLSTERDRDEARAIAVLHTALDRGVTLLDTADAYCWDAEEVGHNERLIARALATWSGDRSRVRVATKGGLTRPQGAWVADGRARHLVAACAASRRALGVERIHLYQLHAPDPRTPLSTSVRALASLQRDGAIEHIGLCNVNVGQIEEARRIVDIAAVQVELSVWHEANFLSGVAEYCRANGIRLIAYRPLGGPQRVRRTQSDALLIDLAARHGVTTFETALAWLIDLSPLILPIPGPTRVETAAALGRERLIDLTDEDRIRFDERFPAAAVLRRSRASASVQPAPCRHDGEVVLIMGLPGAGKTTAARTFVEQGYERLNRDEDGGSLQALLPLLDRRIDAGCARFVLDNTYVSRKSRAPLIQLTAKRGLPVRCVWLATSIEDAQVNAASRMLANFGRLLGPEEIRRTARQDVSAFGPSVQFRYQRELEPPHASEGFSRIDTIRFERTHDPSFTNRAVIVWCDGVLARSRSARRVPSSPDDVEAFAERGAVLRRYEEEGWHVAGLSWQPEIADEILTAGQVEAVFARMQELLGVAIDVRYCPHAAGPPACWCRKPLPGLGVVFIQQHRLDPARCIYVGAGPQDPGFARRLGFQYRDAADFFLGEKGERQRLTMRG
jgi:aryl-alcohol dehydrogenase-like predicted oxidoreductase/histidinol phosphatase-like enzyme/predicted kinase